MTCYKRQKFVKLINLHNWQLWKKKAGKSELTEMVQLNVKPGEVLFTCSCYQATVRNAFAVLFWFCKPGLTLHYFEDFLSLGAQLGYPSKGSLFH